MLYAAILWVASAVVIIRAAWRVRQHPDAARTGRFAFAFLYLVAGAGMNALFLVRGDDYAKFADGAYISFVRHAWHTLVVPHHEAWIALLILFEGTVGLLAVIGRRKLQLAYALAITFHIALLSFGWGFYAWSLPMIAALAALLHAERRQRPADNTLTHAVVVSRAA
jgi:hypothetical protein